MNVWALMEILLEMELQSISEVGIFDKGQTNFSQIYELNLLWFSI